MKRKRHDWRQVAMFSCTDKQAAQAYAPDGPRSVLSTERAIAAWVQCAACEGLWEDVQDTFCPGGAATILLPGPN